MRLGKFSQVIKRFADFLVASAMAMALAPLIILIAFAIRLKLGSPIIFSQIRPGLHAKPFRIIKFRTMIDARTVDGELLSDADRLTPFGNWLRSTSLDELPELWNIILGEMSFVGPRPLLTQYLPLYSADQSRRHEARPGLTGWAQINGRNAIGWPEKLSLDLWYVDHRSLALDLKILFLTALKIVRREGISAAGEATMPAFRGETEI